jgi:hypothetical protein
VDPARQGFEVVGQTVDCLSDQILDCGHDGSLPGASGRGRTAGPTADRNYITALGQVAAAIDLEQAGSRTASSGDSATPVSAPTDGQM